MVPSVGSVGDIITIGKLITELITALNDCRGSAHSFQLVVQELQAFGAVIQETDNLIRNSPPQPGRDALRAALGQVCENSRMSIAAALSRVRKYQDSLKIGGSGHRVQDTARKVQWKIFEVDEAEKFRLELIARTSSLHGLLLFWNM